LRRSCWTAPFADDELAAIMPPMPTAPSPGLVDFVRALRPPGPRTVARVAMNLRRARPIAAVGSGMRGTVDLAGTLEPLRTLTGDTWPDRALWITAVGSDGGLRVFGREEPVPTLTDAVAASCAVPGLFAPVEIHGDRYIDGGAHSPTNADVLVGQGLDLLIISSPMSARAGAERSRWDSRARQLFHAWADHEAGQLREAGAEVVLVEPGEGLLRIMGTNAMASDRSGAVLREAFLETGELLQRTSVRAPLEPLRTSARPDR
jgi:NTE family protein